MTSDFERITIELYNQAESKFTVRRSPLHGFGLFAKEDIYENEFITYYPGPLVSRPLFRRYAIEWRDAKDSSLIYYIDPFVPGTFLSAGCGHLVNSSHPFLPAPYNEPNCELVARNRPPWVSVHAKNGIIEKGTELLVDYHWMLTFACNLSCNCQTCITEQYHGIVGLQAGDFLIYLPPEAKE
jgi:hypothetical protein